MSFNFTEEQQLMRQAVRDLLDRECSPGHVRQAWSNDSGRIPGLWEQLAELGIVGMTVPETYGGLGLKELDWVLLLEEAGRAALPEPLLETVAVAVPLLLELGSKPLQAQWLPQVASGAAVITTGLEPDSHVFGVQSAQLLLLQHGKACHAVTPTQVQTVAAQSVDRSRRPFRVTWQPSPKTQIAEGGAALQALERGQSRAALASAAQLLGLSQRLLDITLEYSKLRQQFGKPIGSFQAVKHRLVDTLLHLEFARPLVYQAAYALHNNQPRSGLSVSMAKLYASRAAQFASDSALQLHGAIGYTYEYDLHQWMKRAWALSRAAGDEPFHMRRVRSYLLGDA